MPVIRIDLAHLGSELRSFERRMPKAVERGLVRAAHRARRLMVNRHSTGHLPVYLGQMRNSWAVQRVTGGAHLVNDAPHAGIIEEGCRPHKVSREGQEAIFRWALKKLGGSPSAADNAAARKKARSDGLGGAWQAESASGRAKAKAAKEDAVVTHAKALTWAVIKKINREGQKGLFVLKKALPEIEAYCGEEIVRAIADMGRDKDA